MTIPNLPAAPLVSPFLLPLADLLARIKALTESSKAAQFPAFCAEVARQECSLQDLTLARLTHILNHPGHWPKPLDNRRFIHALGEALATIEELSEWRFEHWLELCARLEERGYSLDNLTLGALLPEIAAVEALHALEVFPWHE